MNKSNDDVKRKNQNGSLSKTFNRKLKPISFCLSDPDQVQQLDKIEKFTYGNYFKNIVSYLTADDVKAIENSNEKCEPILPSKLVEMNIKKGFLTCRFLAKSLVKNNLVDTMLHELRNFISDEFISQIAEDRGLLTKNSTDSFKQTISTFEYEETPPAIDSSYKMTPPPTIFSNQSLNVIKELVRKHENLPPNIEIDNDFVEQFISENPELISNL